MGRWGFGFLAVICAVGTAACSNGSGHRIGPRIAGVRFPAPVAVDPGVMHVGPVPTATNHDFLPATPGGLRLTLDRCELRAPGAWVFSGRVAVPHGKHDATMTLDLGFANGDVVRSTWAHRVTFAKSGSFAVAVPGPTPAEGDPLRSADDGVSDCDADIVASSVPVADQGAFLAPSAMQSPFMYKAPTGSIQAFGIGAPLGEPLDPRTVSLYTVWSAARSPIRDVYVPVVNGERPALLSIKPARPKCSAIAVGVGPDDGDPANQVTVTTDLHCGPADDDQSSVDTHQSVGGAPGFTWWRPAYPDSAWIARRSVGSVEVWVQGGAAVARDRVARIAATLTTLRNASTP